MELYKGGVLSLAKNLLVVGVVFGFIYGGISFLLLLISGIAGVMPSLQAFVGGLISWVGLTIGGAITGFVGGAIAALVFNFITDKIGGIEIDIK